MNVPGGFVLIPADSGNPTGVDTQAQYLRWGKNGVDTDNAEALRAFGDKCRDWTLVNTQRRNYGQILTLKPQQPEQMAFLAIPDAPNSLGIWMGSVGTGVLMGSPCPDLPTTAPQPMPASNPIGPQLQDGTGRYQNLSVWNGAPFYPLGYVWTAADGSHYEEEGVASPFGIYAWWVKL